MEEMLDAALVADEAEALVDQKASDGTRRHTSVLREHFPRGNPGGVKLSAEAGRRERPAFEVRRRPAERPALAQPGTPAALSLKTGPV
jgi:hypothetical protein